MPTTQINCNNYTTPLAATNYGCIRLTFWKGEVNLGTVHRRVDFWDESDRRIFTDVYKHHCALLTFDDTHAKV